jgi:hypothetical protein
LKADIVAELERCDVMTRPEGEVTLILLEDIPSDSKMVSSLKGLMTSPSRLNWPMDGCETNRASFWEKLQMFMPSKPQPKAALTNEVTPASIPTTSTSIEVEQPIETGQPMEPGQPKETAPLPMETDPLPMETGKPMETGTATASTKPTAENPPETEPNHPKKNSVAPTK